MTWTRSGPWVPVVTNAAGVVPGFRMYVAAYGLDLAISKNDALKGTIVGDDHRHARRGNALLGRVFGTFAVEPFLRSVLGATPLEVDFEWFAGAPSATNRLNHTGRPVFALTPAYAEGLHTKHDGTIQSLYAVGLTLGRTRKEARNRAVVEQRLGEVGEQLDQAITDLRQYLLAHSHTEPREAPRSLTQALEELVQRWKLTHPAAFRLQAEPEAGADFPAHAGAEILLIAHEAVSNSLRHGQAKNVSLWLRTVNGQPG
ncbi:MAG: hypothetical protein AAB676_21420 [Verrucomicrobiota bacterium]